MKIALYGRVSTKDKGQDYENQLLQLRAFVKSQGWEIMREYCDTKSAKNSDRDAFKELFRAASRREFDLVLFWSLDRFSREGALPTLQLLQQLSSYGVGFRSFTEPYLDSSGMFKDVIISMLAVLAKQERIRLSERTVAGLERARAKGSVLGRPKVVCDRKKIINLWESGLSLGAIAKQIGVSKTTIHDIVSSRIKV